MDSTRVGFFLCKDQADLIKKWNLRQFIEFQKKFPNAIVLFLDYDLLKSNSYPFKCFRINKSLMELVDIIEVEEEGADIFKKFTTSEEILKQLNFSIVEDVQSLFAVLANRNETEGEFEEVEDKNISKKYGLKNLLCSKM
jgi:hypothetical protein